MNDLWQRRFGQLAIARGYLRREMALESYGEAAGSGRLFSEVLVEKGLLTEEQARAIAASLEIPEGRVDASRGDHEPASSRLPRELPGPTSGPSARRQDPLETRIESSSELPRREVLAPPQPGDWIGGYELVDKLGEGGMGAVYRARRGAHEIALKLLPRDADEEGILRFEREGQAVASVGEHPNVVRVHAAGFEGDQRFLVQQLIEGESLDRRLIRDPDPWPWTEALELVEQVAQGLEHIHKAGLVHRDIKPANIMLRADDDRPLITDFGIVKLWGEERLTETGFMLGTPAYMAPEHFRDEPLGSDTDVWALSVVLYELLCGQRPFLGANPVALVEQICERSVERPSRYVPELPEDVEALVLRGLARVRRRRFSSAGAFAEDCAALLGHGGSLPGSRSEWPESAALRRPSWVVGAMVLAASLIASVMLLMDFGDRRPSPMAPALVALDTEETLLGAERAIARTMLVELGYGELTDEPEEPLPDASLRSALTEALEAASEAERRARPRLSRLDAAFAALSGAPRRPRSSGRARRDDFARAVMVLGLLRGPKGSPVPSWFEDSAPTTPLGRFSSAALALWEGRFADVEAAMKQWDFGEPGLGGHRRLLRVVSGGERLRQGLFGEASSQRSAERQLTALEAQLETDIEESRREAFWRIWNRRLDVEVETRSRDPEGLTAARAAFLLLRLLEGRRGETARGPQLPRGAALIERLRAAASREFSLGEFTLEVVSDRASRARCVKRLGELLVYERELGTSTEVASSPSTVLTAGFLARLRGHWAQALAASDDGALMVSMRLDFSEIGLLLPIPAEQFNSYMQAKAWETARHDDPDHPLILCDSLRSKTYRLVRFPLPDLLEDIDRLERRIARDPRCLPVHRSIRAELLASVCETGVTRAQSIADGGKRDARVTDLVDEHRALIEEALRLNHPSPHKILRMAMGFHANQKSPWLVQLAWAERYDAALVDRREREAEGRQFADDRRASPLSDLGVNGVADVERQIVYARIRQALFLEKLERYADARSMAEGLLAYIRSRHGPKYLDTVKETLRLLEVLDKRQGR